MARCPRFDPVDAYRGQVLAVPLATGRTVVFLQDRRPIADLTAQRNRWVSDVAHELKTPLTSIRGFSEAILDGTIDDAEGIEHSARIISNESNRVLRLVEELLDLSRIESGQVSMRREDVDLEGRVAAGVENLAGDDVLNQCHRITPVRSGERA